MFFGKVPKVKAVGAILAHGEGTLKKGSVISENDILPDFVTIARLDPTDINENEAATFIAQRLTGEGVRAEKAHTGRVNLFAEHAGLFEISVDNVNAINMLNEAITLATLNPYTHVKSGDMIATVKIIPYGVPKNDIEELEILPLTIKPFINKTVALIQTKRAGLEKAMAKTERVTAERLNTYGATQTSQITAHDEDILCKAIMLTKADLIIIFGASAIADRRDVIPAALVKAGGKVEHLGMPVDPGNLLMLGYIGKTPVLGAPGCARSSKHNGFDFVLDRLMAGIKVTTIDIKKMGVGGLIAEIPTRPAPRLSQ